MPKGVYDHSHLVKPPAERFWAKVNRNGPIPTARPELGPCWLWKGARLASGHGAFNMGDGRVITASHAALELTSGPLAPGMGGCHKCDNPPCVNPGHLFPGTQTDNMADMRAKGRGSSGQLHGEASPHAKLTKEQVAAMRAEYVPRSRTHGSTALARKYGLHYSTVCSILRGDSWRAGAAA